MKSKDDIIVLNNEPNDGQDSSEFEPTEKLEDSTEETPSCENDKSQENKQKSTREIEDSPQEKKDTSADDSIEEQKVSEVKKKKKDQKTKTSVSKVTKTQKKSIKKVTFEIEGTTEIVKVELLSKSIIFQTLYYVLSFFTFGILMLINKWSNNKLFSKFCFRIVASLHDADNVALTDVFGFFIISPLIMKNVSLKKNVELETFVFEHNYRVYYFNDTRSSFCNLFEVTEKDIFDNFTESYKSPRVEDEVALLRDTFGMNKLQPNLKSFRSLATDSLLTPLVFFEAICLSLILWNEQLIYFSLLLAIFLVVLTSNVHEKYQREARLLNSINFGEQIMAIRKTRDGVFKKKIIDSSELVIGDLVEITNTLKIPADMVLIQGVCVVKEDFSSDSEKTSTRIALDTMGISNPKNQKCSLLAGNQVLYTLCKSNESCLAVVVRIGFNCKRAEKLKQIINNQIKQKQKSWEIYLLVACIMVCFAYPVLVILYTKIFHKGTKLSIHKIMAQLYDIVIIFMKPIIPLLILLVVKLSTRRLKAQNISVNDQEKFKITGRIREVIFENKLLVAEEKTTAGVVLNNQCDNSKPTFEKIFTNLKRLFKSAETNECARKFCEVAGLCNLVFKVGSEYFGSETEKELMSESAFNLVNYNNRDVDFLRCFVPKNEFSKIFSREYQVVRFLTNGEGEKNKLQSVLVKNFEKESFILTKGDPNTIENMFDQKTLPSNFNLRVAKYANKGFKCLAFGYRKIKDCDLDQAAVQLEKNLIFVGFYLFKFSAPENISEVSRTLQANDVNVILMTNGSIFSGIASARNNEIISADKKVVLLQTETVDGVEKFLVTMMEPKTGSISINESMISGNKLDLIPLDDSSQNEVLKSNDSIAITGKAFNLLCEKESKEYLEAILNRCRVYGNLTDDERAKVIRLMREKNQETPVCYVYEDMGSEKTIKEADISINLKANSLSPYSTFASSTSDLGQVLDIIKEGRATFANLSQIVFFSLFFVCLEIIAFSILVFKDTTFSRVQLLYLDFFVFAGFALFQANIKPLDLSADKPNKSIFNRNMLIKLATCVTTSSAVLLFVNWLLLKTKFYLSPSAMSANTKDKSPESFFYYDPYVNFISLVFLNIFFVFHSHRNNKFIKSFFGKIGLIGFWCVNFVFAFYLLFIYDFSAKWLLNQALIKVFRIPGMFHFEVIIFLFLPIAYMSFNLAGYLQDRLLKSNSSKSIKGQDEELSISTDEPAEKNSQKKRKAPLLDDNEGSVENERKPELKKSIKYKGQKEAVAKPKVQNKKTNFKVAK